MRKSAFFILGAALISLLMLSLPIGLSAQSIWLPPAEQNNFSLENYKTDWRRQISNVSFSTSVWFLTVEQYVTPSLALIGELPFSHYESKSSGFYPVLQERKTEDMIGNPYFGLKFQGVNSSIIGEVGFRIPVASEEKYDAAIVGFFSDFDRREAFIPNLLMLRARVGRRTVSQSGIVKFQMLVGGTLWIPTKGEGDVELFGDFTSKLWVQEGQFVVSFDLVARTLLTESGPSFKERSEFQVGFSTGITLGSVRPGVHIHVPLTDEGLIRMGSAVDAIYGINITVLLGQE